MAESDRTNQVSTGCVIVQLAVLGVIIVIGILVWALDIPRRLTGEVRWISKEGVAVTHEFLVFDEFIGEYHVENRVPHATLADVLREKYHPRLRLLNSAHDPWGRPFIYHLESIHQADRSIDFIVTLRSTGPNGIDELGKGDDIQRVMHGCALPDRPAKQ